ncbi:MAG: response regulator [Proteobacteria bacterium]|nr:response regulator [Pseudomonadota bacterium]
MKTLIVDDDRSCRKLLQAILGPYSECHTAENGEEAVESFKRAWKENQPYDLILMDIMMPEMDGHQALKEIRNLEEEKAVFGTDGVKVIMTTVLSDRHSIMEAFHSQCESYLVKPIDRWKLLNEIQMLGLITVTS